MQSNGNYHILALVGGIAIIALFVPVFMSGGSPFSQGLDVAEFAFKVITNNTGANPEYNVTADTSSDSMQLIGENINVTMDYPNDRIILKGFVANIESDTTASNLGSGAGVFAQKVLDNLEFKGLTTAGDGIVITPDSNNIQFSLNNIPKSEVSLSGTWVDADLPSDVVYTDDIQTLTLKSLDADSNTITDIDDNEIKAAANIAWSKISKSGSVLNDIGAPSSSYSFSSQRLTSLGTPSASSDAQRVDKLGLQSVVIGGCSNGAPLEYQTSNSTWICGVDSGAGSAIISINGDTDETQTIVGVTGNTTVSTSAGETTVNLGTNVVTTGGSAQTITKGLTTDSLTFGGNANANSNRLTSLGTPSSTTDAQRVDKLGLQSVVTSTCADGAPLEYQVSNSTWICGTDGGGGSIASINGDSTAAQVFSGTSGNVTITDTGAGTLEFNLGTNVVMTTGPQTITGKSIDADDNTIIDIDDNEIKTAAGIAWSKINKSGSSIHELSNVTSTGCATGQILKVSGTTWECATDSGGISTINSDSTSAQVFSGSTNEITLDDTGSGTIVFDVGTDIVQIDQTNTYTGTNAQALGTSYFTFGSDPADAGQIRMSNAGSIAWESDVAGTDVDFSVDSNENFVFDSDGNNIDFNSNPIIDGVLGANLGSGSNLITSYGIPTASTDVQRVDKLGLQSVITSSCSNGAPLEYQTSNSTWICGTDATGAGLESLNGDNTAAQVLSGTSGNVTISDVGAGLLEFNLGTNVVMTTGPQTVTGKSMSGATNTFSAIPKSAIDSAGTFPWTEISKTGSSIHDLSNVTSTGCAVGEILKVSGTNWICSADNGITSAVTSINSDTTAAQVFSGVGNNVTITDTGAGTLSFNIGTDVVVLTGPQTISSKSIDADLNTIVDIDDNEIKALAAIAWSKISKSGAILNDIGSPTSDYSFGSVKITLLGTPTVSTDAQRVDRFVLGTSLVTSACANGAIIEYQTSNSTWICGTDDTGSGGALDDVYLEGTIISNSRPIINFNDTSTINFSIDDDSGLGMSNVTAVIISGSVGNAELGTGLDTTQLAGGGVTSSEFDFLSTVTSNVQTQIDGKQASLGFTPENTADKNTNNGYAGLGSTGQLQKAQQNGTTVYNDQANTYSGTNAQAFGSSFLTFNADPADAGFLRFPNAGQACWEASAAGTDQCIGNNASEDFVFDAGWNNIDHGSNPTVNAIIRADGTGNSISADPRIAVLTAGGATLQAAASPAKNTIDGTNMDYITLDFDTTTAETAIWNWEIPLDADTSQNIVAVVSFQVASGTAGVCFDGSFLGRTAGETTDASFGTVIGGCDSSTGTTSIETATLTFTNAQHGLAAGDIVFFKLARDVADGTDTNANDARVISVKVSWS